jgi:hypothetical protein
MIRHESDVTKQRIRWLIKFRRLLATPRPFLFAALARDWENRLLAKETKVRATAEAILVQGTRRSFPLLRRSLDSRRESLHLEAFKIIQQRLTFACSGEAP